MNGSGTPVKGIVVVMPPMLINAWKAIQVTMPVASSTPKGSGARKATW
jgi:hypothetical protein